MQQVSRVCWRTDRVSEIYEAAQTYLSAKRTFCKLLAYWMPIHYGLL